MIQLAQHFRNIGASYLFVTPVDKQTFVSSVTSNPMYAVIETSGTVNLCKNIMHLFSHWKIYIYKWKDNTLKNYNIFPQYELLSFEHILKNM